MRSGISVPKLHPTPTRIHSDLTIRHQDGTQREIALRLWLWLCRTHGFAPAHSARFGTQRELMHNIGFAPAPYCCGNHRAAKGHVGEVGNLWRCRPGDLWLRNQGCVVSDVGDPRLRNQGRVVGDLGDVGDHWLCNQVRAGGVSVLQFRRRCRPCNQGCVGDFPLFQRCFGIQAAARFSCQDRRGFAIQAAARQAGGQSKSLAPPRSFPLPPGVRVARLTTTTISSIRLPLSPHRVRFCIPAV